MAIHFNKNTLDAWMVIGDTGDFSIRPRLNNEFFLKDGDHVWFTLRKLKDRSILIQKDITTFEEGRADIPISPSDTENLEAGNYLYDIKIIRSDGTVDTINPNKESSYFQLKKGVK